MVRLHQILWSVIIALFCLFSLVTSQTEGRSPQAFKALARALAKWPRLKSERVTLLPLSPVPRPPTIREEKLGLRGFIPGGPAMAVVRGQRIYVVDDVKSKLLECSMEGKILRDLALPKDAPKSLSGALNLCGDLLWVGFEKPYAFAVDLNDWRIVEERRWKSKWIVAGLFAMPDKTLYIITPGKRLKYGDVVWQIIKVEPNGKQQAQMVEGWRPAYVDLNEMVYWTTYEPVELRKLSKTVKIGYSQFGDIPTVIAEIHAESFDTNSIQWAFGSPVVGLIKGAIIGHIFFTVRDPDTGIGVFTPLFLHIQKSGQVKALGREPLPGHGMPVRSLYLPEWWTCEGQVYSIVREDIGEHSRFWLVRLKL